MKVKKTEFVFAIEIVLYILCLYAISACVFLNGDDFMYGAFSRYGILQNVGDYYIMGNGRFWINIIDSVLLLFDRYLFILVNPFIVMIFLLLLAKNIQWICEKKSDKQKEKRYFRYGMVLFACLDVLCMRETVFWITGMMNYLFPATVFLLALLLFQHNRSSGVQSIPQKIVFCVVCLLAGSSVEQFALMYFGMTTLLLGVDLICKRCIPKVLLVGYLCSMVGLCVLLLAPGNFVRVDAQSKIMPMFIDNLWVLVYQNSMSPVAFPYLLMLSMCGSLCVNQKAGTRLLRISSMIVPVAMVTIRCVPLLEKAVLITGVLILFIIQLFHMFVHQKYTCKAEVIALIFVGFGSQVMLLVSAIWGFRCMFSMYMVYMLLLLLCLPKLETEKRLLVLGSGIAGSLNPILVGVLWLIYFMFKTKKNILILLQKVLIHTLTAAAMTVLLLGYAQNVPTHVQNVKNSAKSVELMELCLEELPDEKYSWYFIPMGEFHERYYRIYHNLPATVRIEYRERNEE